MALSNPERIGRDIIERSEKKSLSKGEITAELENRGLGVKRAKFGKKAVSGKGRPRRPISAAHQMARQFRRKQQWKFWCSKGKDSKGSAGGGVQKEEVGELNRGLKQQHICH